MFKEPWEKQSWEIGSVQHLHQVAQQEESQRRQRLQAEQARNAAAHAASMQAVVDNRNAASQQLRQAPLSARDDPRFGRFVRFIVLTVVVFFVFIGWHPEIYVVLGERTPPLTFVLSALIVFISESADTIRVTHGPSAHHFRRIGHAQQIALDLVSDGSTYSAYHAERDSLAACFIGL